MSIPKATIQAHRQVVDALEKAMAEARSQWLEARGQLRLMEAGLRIGDIVEQVTPKSVRRYVICGAGYWPIVRLLRKDGTLGDDMTSYTFGWGVRGGPKVVARYEKADELEPAWVDR